VTIVFIGLVGVFTALGFVVVPPVAEQGGLLADNAPKYLDNLLNNRFIQDFDSQYHVIQRFQTEFQKLIADGNFMSGVFGGVLGAGKALAAGFFSFLTVLVLTLYFLSSLPKVEYAQLAQDPALVHRWLLGWSFGSDLALMYGDGPSVEGAILLSPALRFSRPEHLRGWAQSGLPLVALVPELDDYLRPDEAVERFGEVPQARVVGVEGAKHLWVGEKYVRRALDEIVATVRPGSSPLPETWEGPLSEEAAGATP
jgi:pimeloyl-ACP methyl ester carboxylesterase